MSKNQGAGKGINGDAEVCAGKGIKSDADACAGKRNQEGGAGKT